MLEAPRTDTVRPSASLNVWQLLRASRQWAPVSSKIAPWVMTISWILSAIFPWIIGQAINAGFDPDRTGLSNTFLMWVGIMAAGSVIVFPLLAGRHHATMQTRLSTIYWLRAGLSQKVIDGGAAATDDLPAGEVLTSAASDADSMGELSMSSVQFMGWITALTVALGLTAQASPTIAIVLVIGVLLSMTLSVPVSRIYRARLAKQRAALADLTDHTTDGISGLRVLRGVGGHGQFLDEYATASTKTADRSIAAGAAYAGIITIAALTPGVLTLVLVIWGALDVRDGSLNPGDVVMIAGAARFLYMPVTQLGLFPSLISKASVATGRINELLSVPTHTDPADARTDALPNGDLTDPITGVRAAAGKLTVLRSHDPANAADVARRLARLDPTEPAGHIAGEPLTQWAIPTIRQHITLNDTHPMLLSGTLRRQLDPWSQHTDDALHHALYVAAADDVVQLLPDGLDDYVTERGRSLSGGQRQRVALARVVAKNPPVLIVVEPTSAVDAYTESLVVARLAEHRAGHTTVVVSGSPLFADVADRVVDVDEVNV